LAQAWPALSGNQSQTAPHPADRIKNKSTLSRSRAMRRIRKIGHLGQCCRNGAAHSTAEHFTIDKFGAFQG